MAKFRLIIGVLLLQIIVSNKCSAETAENPPSSLKETSHSHIHDAIKSQENIFQKNSDESAKQETRGRQLRDQVKISFSQVDREQKLEESNRVTVMNTLNMIYSRLEALENVPNRGVLCKDIAGNSNTSNNVQQLASKLILLEQYIKNNDDLLQNIKKSMDAFGRTQTIIQQQLTQLIASQNQREADLIAKFDAKLAKTQPTSEKLDKILELQNISVLIQTSTLINNGHSNDSTSMVDQLLHMKEDFKKYVKVLEEKIEHVEEILLETQQNMRNEMLNSTKADDNLRMDMVQSYDQFAAEIKGFSKTDHVLTQMAGNVSDVKSWVDNGIRQILLQVEELINSTSKDTNDTINKRLDTISNEIVANQDVALRRFTAEMDTVGGAQDEMEMMRDVIMDWSQEIKKLQQQTETHVNGSSEKMDKVQGKFSQIISRMDEFKQNLDQQISRSSHFTLEFKLEKNTLMNILEEMYFHLLSMRGMLP